jgi:hypothetical protein
LNSGPDIDSRRWTGPEPQPPAAERQAARNAFLAAGGTAAGKPQRATSAVSWAGLAVLPLVVLAGADEHSWLPGLHPLAAWFRALLAPALGAEWAVAAAGDPRLLGALVALGGSIAGIVSAWRHRAALARGFAAAGDGFLTRRFGGAAPLMLVLVSLRPADGPLLALNALALWLIARLAAGSLTALAERLAAGCARRAERAAGWDVATLLASLGGLSLVLAHVLGALE